MDIFPKRPINLIMRWHLTGHVFCPSRRGLGLHVMLRGDLPRHGGYLPHSKTVPVRTYLPLDAARVCGWRESQRDSRRSVSGDLPVFHRCNRLSPVLTRLGNLTQSLSLAAGGTACATSCSPGTYSGAGTCPDTLACTMTVTPLIVIVNKDCTCCVW